MKWIDSTSYSRGEQGTVEPRARGVSTTAHFGSRSTARMGCPGCWFVSAHDIGIERAQLAAVGAEVAKEAAIAYVRARLAALQKAFDKATLAPGPATTGEKR